MGNEKRFFLLEKRLSIAEFPITGYRARGLTTIARKQTLGPIKLLYISVMYFIADLSVLNDVIEMKKKGIVMKVIRLLNRLYLGLLLIIISVACSAEDGNQQLPTTTIGNGGDQNAGAEPVAGIDLVSSGDMRDASGITIDRANGGISASGSGGSSQLVVDGGECGAVVEKAEMVLTPVDIIFGIDTSMSMIEEVLMMQENLNAFSQQIIDANIDAHVIVLSALQTGAPVIRTIDGPCIAPPLGSGSCPDDSLPPTYVHIDALVTSFDVLDVYINQYPQYKPHLRENSLKTFVTISDDNATNETHPMGSMNPDEKPVHHNADLFIDAVAQLEPGSPMWSNWRYSGIYSFTMCPASLMGAVGEIHAELVQRTQGVAGDLCLQDFQPVFDELAKELVSGSKLACDWAIPAPPEDELMDIEMTSVQFTLNGIQESPLPRILDGANCADHDAWYYDRPENPTRIFACPVTCERVQAADRAEVGILFGCEPPIVLE